MADRDRPPQDGRHWRHEDRRDRYLRDAVPDVGEAVIEGANHLDVVLRDATTGVIATFLGRT